MAQDAVTQPHLSFVTLLETLPTPVIRQILLQLRYDDIIHLTTTCSAVNNVLKPFRAVWPAWRGPYVLGQQATPNMLRFYFQHVRLGRKLGVQTSFLTIVGCLATQRLDCATIVFKQLMATCSERHRDQLTCFRVDLVHKVMRLDSPAIVDWWLSVVYPAFEYSSQDLSRLVRLTLHHVVYYDRPRLLAVLLRQGFVPPDIYSEFQPPTPHEEAAVNDRGLVMGMLMDHFNLMLTDFPLDTIQQCRASHCELVLNEWSERLALQAQSPDFGLDAMWAEVEAQRQALS